MRSKTEACRLTWKIAPKTGTRLFKLGDIGKKVRAVSAVGRLPAADGSRRFAQCNEDQRRTMHNATGTKTNTTDIVTLLHKHVRTVYTQTDMFNLQFAQCNEDQRRTMHNVQCNWDKHQHQQQHRQSNTTWNGLKRMLHYAFGTKTSTVAKTTLFFNCCLKVLTILYEDAHFFVCKRLSISQSFNRQFSIPLFHSLQHCEIHEQIDTWIIM